MLKAQGSRQLFWHVPQLHQPGTDLFAADAQQVLFHIGVVQMRVDLKVAANQRKMRWEHVRQQQVAKVVQ
ncbi:hypothetical protein D9M73_256460 [compost metagenome]